MDSLLASYASSDEEDDHHHPPPPPKQIQPSQSQPNFFTSLPPPKSSSLFSKLPQPKSERSDPFSLNPPKPKKVVQFRPPLPTPNILDDDDDDEEDGVKELKKKDVLIPEAPSVKSFLTSIPAPRNSGSLGGFSSAAGTGRRSILDAEVPGLSHSNVVKVAVDKPVDNNNNLVGNVNDVSFDVSYANVAATSADYGNYDYGGYGEYQNVGTDYGSYGPAAPGPGGDDHVGYGGYEGYSGYGNYGEYESKWIDRSSGDLGNEIPVAEVVQSVARVPGKRGRSEIPQDIIEVSQDELMKNRPREDKTKLTGIAFGPSYQPASSTKGKPTKLHKRKHQIGSLYFDMRSKESELAERRSKGLLTKAETHAKYGW